MAPVANEHSSLASQQVVLATSCGSTKRFMGIFESMYSMCSVFICENISVFAAAGDTQLTRMFFVASSLPKDFVSAMSPAFEAL